MRTSFSEIFEVVCEQMLTSKLRNFIDLHSDSQYNANKNMLAYNNLAVRNYNLNQDLLRKAGSQTG